MSRKIMTNNEAISCQPIHRPKPLMTFYSILKISLTIKRIFTTTFSFHNIGRTGNQLARFLHLVNMEAYYSFQKSKDI